MVLEVKNLPANAGDARDAGLIPGLGRSPGGGHGNTPVFLPGESQGRGSLVCMRAPVYGVAQSWTRLMWLSSSSSSRGIWDLSSSTMDLLLSPAVESAQSLNYWTAREAPIYRDIYHGIFLKQRKGYNLNPQIGDWLRNYVSTVLMKNHVTRHVV